MRDVFNDFVKMSRDEGCIRKRARDAVDDKVMKIEIPLASRSLVIDSLRIANRQDPVALLRSYAENHFWLDRFPERREEFERDFKAITAAYGATTPD
jgi:hypothetical protein